MHTDFIHAFLQRTDRKGIVEIFRIFRVDSESGQFAAVAALADLLFRDIQRDLFSRFQHIGRELHRQFIFGHNRIHFRIVIPGTPQHLDHFSHRILLTFRPIFDFYHHFIPVFGSIQMFRRDEHIIGQLLTGRYQESVIRRPLYYADKSTFLPFQDLDHLSFGAAVTTPGIYQNLHFISVQGVFEVRKSNKHILFTLV